MQCCPTRHRIRVLTLGGLISLAGCETTDRVDVRDGGLLLPNLRVERPSERSEAGGPRWRSRSGVDVEAAYAAGTFAGGASDYELWAAQTLVWYGTEPQEPLFARLLAGLEYQHLALDVPGLATDTTGGLGPVAGLDLAFEVATRTELYVRGTAAGLLPEALATRVELGLRGRPVPSIELSLGYRWWRVRYDDLLDGLGGLEVDMKLDGVVLGLGLSF